MILSEFGVWVLAAKPVYWFEKRRGYGCGLMATDTDTAKQHTRTCTRWVTLVFNLMEQFVNGVGEFAASIVNLKLLFELRILKEKRGFREFKVHEFR